ncbi:hypothetical protein [Tsuneonella sp. SYSU-LHT278]|uniref:hypothetical protein n=1 Tax=Tsuneonella sediminis TaxID=3416089 RepID=UPI003F7AB92A
MTGWLAHALLIMAQAAPAGAPADVDRAKIDPRVAAQVPKIADKLREWRGGWGAVGDKLACKTVKSSGDEEIDAIGCYATLSCIKPAYPELKAIADGKGTEDEKKAKMRVKLDGLQTCMTQYRGQGIAALALKRSGTGGAGK